MIDAATRQALATYVGMVREVEGALSEAELAAAAQADAEREQVRAELLCADWVRKAAPRLSGRGVCYGHPNPDLWFSSKVIDRMQAAELCSGCPMRGECASSALANHETEGTWGGVRMDGLSTSCVKCGADDWNIHSSERRTCRPCKAARERLAA